MTKIEELEARLEKAKATYIKVGVNRAKLDHQSHASYAKYNKILDTLEKERERCKWGRLINSKADRKRCVLTLTHEVEIMIVAVERLEESDELHKSMKRQRKLAAMLARLDPPSDCIIDFNLRIKARLEKVGRHRTSTYAINFLCSYDPVSNTFNNDGCDRLEVFDNKEFSKIIRVALAEYKEEIRTALAEYEEEIVERIAGGKECQK